MANEIKNLYGTVLSPSCNWSSIASGAGRICTVIDNTTLRAPMAHVFVRVTTGTTPTNFNVIKVFLIRRSNAAIDIVDGALGTADTGVSVEPIYAECIGSIVVSNTSNVIYEQTFRAYDLPPKYSIVLWNATGVALNSGATTTNMVLQVIPVTAEVQ